MKRLIAISLLTFPLLAAPSDWREEQTETITKSFRVAAGVNSSKLIVDQSNGRIHITGGAGPDVQVSVERRARAESKSALADAQKEVTYNITQEGNTIKLYEDGPFRSHNGGHHHSGYNVSFTCEVQVPEGATLDLHTMNGEIAVKNSTGNFTVHTMNGKVQMEGIGGSGSAETMNGAVDVAFNRNPSHTSSFHTMNGAIDLRFHSAPDAEFALETMHGGIFSDFDVTTLPTTVKGEVSSGRTVFRTGGTMKVRAGNGGPEISLKTMNGAIRLHQNAM